jgi:hypothetical protein
MNCRSAFGHGLLARHDGRERLVVDADAAQFFAALDQRLRVVGGTDLDSVGE